jgi:hypothetical protein
MPIVDDTNRFIKFTTETFERRRAALFALSRFFASEALRKFRSLQYQDSFWQNQTGEAARRVFARGFVDDNIVGWFIAHGVEYGVYLELANNGENAALTKITNMFAEDFFRQAQSLYRD